jgi:hypothetical protein
MAKATITIEDAESDGIRVWLHYEPDQEKLTPAQELARQEAKRIVRMLSSLAGTHAQVLEESERGNDR